MQKSTLKKISLLGLVLTGASVVTAAMLPHKSAKAPLTGKCIVGVPGDDGSGNPDVGEWALTCTEAFGQGAECDVTQAGTNQSAGSNTLTTSLTVGNGTGC